VSEVEDQRSDEAFQELIESLSPETRTLAMEAALARDVRDFAQSDVGRYMVGCAKQDIENTYTKLVACAPWRWRRIQQLQNEIRVAEMFLSYLRDLILRGKSAENIMHDSEGS
jgi:hypothetical protein